MFKYIQQFFLFLVPIIRTAVIQVAADTLTKMAYPDKLVGHNEPSLSKQRASRDNTRSGKRISQRISQRKATVNVGKAVREANEIREGFHDVLLVAFDITGPDSMLAHEWLMDNMPNLGLGGDTDEINLDSWWVADDNRLANWSSDCDSAVFVTKGKQREARKLLRKNGLVS